MIDKKLLEQVVIEAAKHCAEEGDPILAAYIERDGNRDEDMTLVIGFGPVAKALRSLVEAFDLATGQSEKPV